MRVGERKHQQFTIKNIGLYKIKYKFTMKKKIFTENFEVEPKEAELDPQ